MDSNGSSILMVWVKAWLLYFAVADSMLTVAVNLGLLPQFVFVPYLIDGAGIWALLAQVVVYPLLIGFSAIKAQYLTNIFMDSLGPGSPGPLQDTADTIAMALGIQSKEGKEKVISALQVSLLVFLAISFGLAYYFTAEGVDLGFITGFLEGSLLMTTVLSYVFLLAEAVVILSSRRESRFGYASLAAQAILPTEPPSGAKWTPLIGVVLSILAQIVVGVLVWFELLGPRSDQLLILSTAAGFLAVGFGLQKLFSRILKPLVLCPCISCFGLVILLAFGIAVLTTLVPALFGDNPYYQLDESFFEPAPKGSSFNTTHRAPGDPLGFGAYPVCNLMQWDRLQPLDGSQLLALDLMIFAYSSWLNSSEDIMADVKNMSLNTEIENIELEFVAPVRQMARVVSWRLPDVKKRVVAIRGSSSANDWLLNLDIWGPAVFFSLVRSALPFGGAIPSSFIHQVLSLDVRLLLGLPAPWQPVVDQIKKLKAKSKEDGFDMVLTGVSLGGGMAAMIGSKEGIQTLAIAPVGSAMTQYRVTQGIVGEEVPLESTVVEITPWGDLIPLLLDQQEGTVQKTACTAFNPWTCHTPSQIICELGRKCGDPRNRSLERHCSKQVGEDWKQVPWKRFAWHSFL